MKKTKILIVDDHAVVRAGLSTILGYEDDFAVIGEAADGAEAVRAAATAAPNRTRVIYETFSILIFAE